MAEGPGRPTRSSGCRAPAFGGIVERFAAARPTTARADWSRRAPCPSRTIPTTGSGSDGPVEPGPAVVFDMDGVLSDAAGRQHYLERPYRDWEAFFAACGDDQLIDEVARLLEVLDPDHADHPAHRPADPGAAPDARLARALPAALGPARSCGTSATTTRRGTSSSARCGELRPFGFDLRLAFEDDRRNYDMFHAEGIPCVYIHSGYYE